MKIRYWRGLDGSRSAPPRPADNLGARIGAGFLYGTGARIELSRPDSLVGPIGVGFPFFDFLARFRLGSFPRSRFGHVIFSFLLELN